MKHINDMFLHEEAKSLVIGFGSSDLSREEDVVVVQTRPHFNNNFDDNYVQDENSTPFGLLPSAASTITRRFFAARAAR